MNFTLHFFGRVVNGNEKRILCISETFFNVNVFNVFSGRWLDKGEAKHFPKAPTYQQKVMLCESSSSYWQFTTAFWTLMKQSIFFPNWTYVWSFLVYWKGLILLHDIARSHVSLRSHENCVMFLTGLHYIDILHKPLENRLYVLKDTWIINK